MLSGTLWHESECEAAVGWKSSTECFTRHVKARSTFLNLKVEKIPTSDYMCTSVLGKDYLHFILPV